MPAPAECQSCEAPVLFVRNVKTGATLIVDAEPLPEPVELKPRLIGVVGEQAKILTRADLDDAGELVADPHPELRWHVDHHATCPSAAEWRGRRR